MIPMKDPWIEMRQKAQIINREIFSQLLLKKGPKGFNDITWNPGETKILFTYKKEKWQIQALINEELIYVIQKDESGESEGLQYSAFTIKQVFTIIKEVCTNIGYTLEENIPLSDFPNFLIRRLEQMFINNHFHRIK